MSHNLVLNSVTGKYEIMTRGAAWHGLGQVVENAQTWEETMRLAGLQWTVSKEQQKNLRTGELIDSYDIYRDDTNAFLGNVGADYTPIQNIEQFQFVDALLEADGGAHYESAGALGGGQRVFCLVNLGAAFDMTGTGDRHETFLLFTNSHNGSQAARVGLTGVRVVCGNTERMALQEMAAADKQRKRAGLASQVLKIRHTRSAQARMALASNVITTARVGVGMVKEKLELLNSRMLTKDAYTGIVDRLFPAPVGKDGKEPSQASVTRRENVLADILKLYESNDDNAFPEIRGTGYNFYNAVTEYVSHVRTPTQTAAKSGWTVEQLQANSALFGGGAELVQSALDVILEETMKSGAPRGSKMVFAPPVTTGSAVLDDVLDATVIK
jgi:phage/plasmid-like protein (TIGR03299 family)